MKFMHYRVLYKGEENWQLIEASRVRKAIENNYANPNEIVRLLDEERKPIETPFAIYQV